MTLQPEMSLSVEASVSSAFLKRNICEKAFKQLQNMHITHSSAAVKSTALYSEKHGSQKVSVQMTLQKKNSKKQFSRQFAIVIYTFRSASRQVTKKSNNEYSRSDSIKIQISDQFVYWIKADFC